MVIRVFCDRDVSGQLWESVANRPPLRWSAGSTQFVSGDAQSGTVREELASPLVVKVVDENGRPLQGQAVNFRVTAGGGSVFASASVTNADGIAQERWTLGTVAHTV